MRQIKYWVSEGRASPHQRHGFGGTGEIKGSLEEVGEGDPIVVVAATLDGLVDSRPTALHLRVPAFQAHVSSLPSQAARINETLTFKRIWSWEIDTEERNHLETLLERVLRGSSFMTYTLNGVAARCHNSTWLWCWSFDSGCKFAFSELQSFFMHLNSKGTEGSRSLHVQSTGNMSCKFPFLSAQRCVFECVKPRCVCKTMITLLYSTILCTILSTASLGL